MFSAFSGVFLFISLSSLTKRSQNNNVEKPRSTYSREREVYEDNFLSIFFEIWRFLTYSVRDISYNIEKLNEVKFSRG